MTAVLNNTEMLYAGLTHKVKRNCSFERHARTQHLRDSLLLFKVVSLKCIFSILIDNGPLLRAFLELVFQNNLQGLVHIALNSLCARQIVILEELFLFSFVLRYRHYLEPTERCSRWIVYLGLLKHQVVEL